MNKYYFFSRREFLNFFKVSFVFLLASCTKISKNTVIAFQKSFLPESFRALLPKIWEKQNINFQDIYSSKNHNYKNSDYLIVNDGWIKNIRFEDFKDINSELFINLNERSRNYLDFFDENIRYKLFPIGLIPYVVIIKNNNEIKGLASKSWNFLLSKDLKGKIILPNSPRILLSIAERIDTQKALEKIIKQENIYDDRNAFDWLINSKAIVAVIPYSLCQKYLKIDSRLSMVFPDNGVPLIWQFIISKSYSNQEPLIEWINSLKNVYAAEKLREVGWYLPYKDQYIKDFYIKKKYENKNISPSDECWNNSWSLPPLYKEEKLKEESLWKKLLTP